MPVASVGSIFQHRIDKRKIIVTAVDWGCHSDEFWGVYVDREGEYRQNKFSEHEVEEYESS